MLSGIAAFTEAASYSSGSMDKDRERVAGTTRMKDLAGKTAFVTGAASGIGLGITTALAQVGVKVMLCDIEEAALAKAEREDTEADER